MWSYRQRHWLWALIAACAVCSAAGLAADAKGYRVIVHPSSTVSVVDRSDLSRMFLKKLTRWPDGALVQPVDLHVDSDVRKHFTEHVLGRTVAAVRSYWQQAIFSGRQVPPTEFETDAEIVAYVLRNQGAIGYVSPGAAPGNARLLEVR